jgi:methionine aminotransferase
LEKIAIDHDLIVLSDEVYERIIFDNQEHQSVLKFPKLASQSIVAVFSFGKTFHATGWKVGYAVAPENLTKEIRKTHQFITFSVNTPVQLALAEYLTNPNNYLELGNFYQRKRDLFLNQIKGSSFQPLPCRGSYFQLLSYEAVSNKNEMAMAEWMTKEKKLAPIPVSAFYKDKSDHKLLRFCFRQGRGDSRKGRIDSSKTLTGFYSAKGSKSALVLLSLQSVCYHYARFKSHHHSSRSSLGRYWGQFGHV